MEPSEGRLDLRIIFASYRDWAQDVSTFVCDHPRVASCLQATTQEELAGLIAIHAHEVDLVMLCGWSWPPEQWMVNAGPLVVSEHPAASDRYSPGTPLQNQIMDGLLTTKHRIVRVGYPELAPRQWSHEVDMSLEGHMDEVLERMRVTSIDLYGAFLRDYPKITWKQWPAVDPKRQMARRTPADSKLTKLQSAIDQSMLSVKHLYDRIRCLEEPYPNAYVEDETGRLYFERVRFEPK